jgi:uncharacterized protein (AIM24 family)
MSLTSEPPAVFTAGDGRVHCRYCRQQVTDAPATCPNCGAPLDLRTAVSRSGWTEQPPIRDLARLQFGRSRVQIEGTQVPVVDVDLADGDHLYFSHHSLLWTEPATRLGNLPLQGGWSRMLAGLPLIMMTAHGPGRIALSDNHAGEVVALPLQHGQTMWVREHRFLTASGNVGYTWQQTGVWFVTGTGDDRETHFPMGQFADLFTANEGPGLLLLHAVGNVFLRDLAAGETILVQPSALLYSDVTVRGNLHLEYPYNQGGSTWRSFELRTVWLRITGPGRVAVQSVFSPPTHRYISKHSPATFARW